MWYFQNVTSGDLSKISDWSIKGDMPFNINKGQILHVGSKNIKKDYEMCGVKIKNVHLVKDIGVIVASDPVFPTMQRFR